MIVTEIVDVDLGRWAPGTRMFKTGDDQYFVVDADTAAYPDGPNTFLRRHTAVLFCNADGSVTDLTPDYTSPPGTTAEDAITAMGYTLEGS